MPLSRVAADVSPLKPLSSHCLKKNSLSNEVRQAVRKNRQLESRARLVRDQEMSFLFATPKQPRPMLSNSMVEPASGTVGG